MSEHIVTARIVSPHFRLPPGRMDYEEKPFQVYNSEPAYCMKEELVTSKRSLAERLQEWAETIQASLLKMLTLEAGAGHLVLLGRPWVMVGTTYNAVHAHALAIAANVREPQEYPLKDLIPLFGLSGRVVISTSSVTGRRVVLVRNEGVLS